MIKNQLKQYVLYWCVGSILIFGAATKAEVHELRVIAIATLMNHPALDAVQNGMKQELARHGYVENKTIRYLVRNASGQIQLAATIANELAVHRPAVTVAITTPMAQAVAKMAASPIVFAAVTAPVDAGLVKALDVGEQDITGTSDAWPYENQLKLIREMTPTNRRLGVLNDPGEPPSQYGMKQLRLLAPHLGFEIVDGPVSSTLDVYPVAQSLASRVDVLLLTSANSVIAGMAGALKVAVDRRMPFYVGDCGSVERGGLAAAAVGYFELGIETGKLVARVLEGERKIPTFVANGYEICVNTEAAKLMGVTIPDSILRRATRVYSEIRWQ
jgi:putative tryptophan/tyrosine transport system substrate-binding protein